MGKDVWRRKEGKMNIITKSLGLWVGIASIEGKRGTEVRSVHAWKTSRRKKNRCVRWDIAPGVFQAEKSLS